VVPIWQQSHTFLRPAIKFGALFSFTDFHLQKKVTNTMMFGCKIYVHPCICIFPSNGNIYMYMPHASNIHIILPTLPHFWPKQNTKSCHDLCSDPCIYLFLISYITSELINSWNMFSYHICALFKITFTYKCHIFVWFRTSLYWNCKQCYIYLYMVICKIFSELKCPKHMQLILHLVKNYSAFSKWHNC